MASVLAHNPNEPVARRTPIDLHNRQEVAQARPLLIAHRGGVIGPDAPENSLNALRHAAEQGFHAVELDVRAAADQEPVLFHGVAGGYLGVDCGVNAFVRDLTSAEVATLRYRGVDQTVLTLDAALRTCAELGLAIMLDLKDLEQVLEPAHYLGRIGELVAAHGLTSSTMSISQNQMARQFLGIPIVWSVNHTVAMSEPDIPAGPVQLWFGQPEALPSELIPTLQRKGLLVIPAVNNFRYPKHSCNRFESADIRRLLAAGVDGIQIDSMYRQFFG